MTKIDWLKGAILAFLFFLACITLSLWAKPEGVAQSVLNLVSVVTLVSMVACLIEVLSQSREAYESEHKEN